MKPNLLVTYDPAHKEAARLEVEGLLKEVKEKGSILKVKNGVLNLRIKDARKAVRKLTNLCEKHPYKFNKTFRYMPVDKWSKSTIKDMQKTIKSVAKDIKNSESWMLSLNKRDSRFHMRELVLKLTELVEKPKVDLVSPNKIIKVEMLGKEAGIALLKESEFLTTSRFKQ